jgi:uncharacterized protein YndB with AHSA1/START domain
MNTAMQDIIEREIVVRATKERVYSAITDPAQIVMWFPDGIEGKLEKGERPIFDFGEYGKNQIYVVAADPHDYFAYRWVSGSRLGPEGFVGDPLTEPHTLVEFRLSETPEGTIVKLKESGFASLPAEIYELSFTDNTSGWAYMFDRLEKYLAPA